MSALLHLFFKPGTAPGKRAASWLPVFLHVLFFAFTGLEVRAQQALNANAAAGNIQCIGGSTTVSIQATGGEAPYQYSLNGIQFQSGAVFSNVAAGTYSGLTVTDNNGTAYTLPTLSIPAGTQPNVTYYRDVDGDGYGNPSLTQLSCTGVPPGFAVNGNDCDDVDALINPGAIEQCNGVDDDCNQLIDDQVAGSVTWYTDNDGDNIGTGTGIVLCYDPGSGFSQIPGDCDDTNDQVHPKSTELCNSIDDDCDGQSDEGLLFENYWYDGDGDQYGTGTPLYLCEDPGTAYATNDFDCNDTNSSIHPSAPETCNGIDDNCNGLTDTNDPLLSPAGPLSATASAAPIACKGGSTTVVITPVGGVTPYSYGSQSLQGVGAGTYTYTVTDANGCTTQTSITLSEPPLLVAGGLHTPVLCNGGISIVNVSASGGVPPYQGTGAVIRNAGTWDLMVTDANGCTAVHTATISEPAPLIADENHTPIACFGGSSTVTISATGGIPPYTGTGSFTQSAGLQTYIITDANGCVATIQHDISEPSPLQVSSTAQPIAVYGGTTTVSVSATGGTPPYLGTGNFVRGSGTYSFTVEDANGCSSATSITLLEPGQLRATATEGTIACFGGNTTVQISASGGVAPYTNTGVFNVSAGPYAFTVTDANGASFTVSGNIPQPSAVGALITASQVICYGDPAIVSVNAAGGIPPYSGTGAFSRVAGTWSFTVSDANGCPASGSISIADALPVVASAHTITPIPCFGQTASVLVTATGGSGVFAGTGLFQRTAGSHRFYVTDSKGCVDSTDMSLSQPPALTASAQHTDVLCNGALTGSIDVSANGGTLPYTYQWNGGQSGEDISNLGAGTYQVTVTDNNGCSIGVTRVITQPPALNSAATAPPILCFGTATQVNVTANGGVAPYTGTGAFARTAGNHTFTVTDANGCTSQSALNITQPTDLTVMAAEVVPVFCNGQSAEILVEALGGTGTYNGIGSFQQLAGIGTYVVTDDNGCKDSAIVTVTQPNQLAIPAVRTNVQCHGGSNGAIVTQPTGGAQPYQYSWSNGNLNPGLSGLVAGTYSLTVTDANGCSLDSTFTITEPLPFPALSGIVGADTACVPYAHGSAVFSVPGISDGVNSTYYLWDVPNGMTISSGQGTGSITVSWTPQTVDPSIIGSINLTASNGCSSSSTTTGVSMAITQPVTPGSISGNSRVCSGEINTYSVAPVGRATNYVWTLPVGLTLLSGQGTNIITVRVESTYNGGNISVASGNACGMSPPRLRATSLNFPSTPGTISGQSSGLCGRSGITYTIAPVNGATSYEWTVPAGATIVSGQGTTSINVNFNTSAGGAIQVCAVNACGLSACRSLTVTTAPARPGVITAVPPTTPCAGSTTNYSVPTVSGANFYNWTCTGGGSILSGQGTKAISVFWAPNTVTTTQSIVVRSQNNCGQSTTRSTVVTVNSCLRSAGTLATEQLGLTVFPNPSSGPIYVRFISGSEEAYELIIYDVQGRMIAKRSGIAEYGENIIDIEKSVFPAGGMYLLDFEHNGVRGQERFTVE